MLSYTAYQTIKKQFTLHLSVRLGWVGGVTDEKGGPGKGGGQDPLTPPPSGHAYASYIFSYQLWPRIHTISYHMVARVIRRNI